MSEWFKEHAWRACRPKRPPGFESLSLRQFDRASPTGSGRPGGAAWVDSGSLCFWGCSSAGRAPRSQRGGRRFDPVHLHIFRVPAVLDGELAVPCDPQSAPAGLNSLPRSLPGGPVRKTRGFEGQAPRNGGLPTPSGPEGSSGTQKLPGAADQPDPSHRRPHRVLWWIGGGCTVRVVRPAVRRPVGKSRGDRPPAFLLKVRRECSLAW